MPESLTTRVLGERAQKGDKEALDKLLTRYQRRVAKAVRVKVGEKIRTKLEFDDVIQDVIYETLKRFAVIDFSSEGAFMAYINKIVESEIRELARYWDTEKRNPDKELPPKNTTSSDARNPTEFIATRSGLTPSKIAAKMEDKGLIDRAMDRLGEERPDYRDVILAVEYEGQTYAEIAAKEGSTPNAVRMRLNRAIHELGKICKQMRKAGHNARAE